MPRRSRTSSFAGRRALVTGGSRRLGRAIALALGSAGAAVAVHYRSDVARARDTVRELREAGATAVACRADLACAEDCKQVVSDTTEALGGLDVLVNNAAVFEHTPLEALRLEHFDEHMAVNARAVFALSLYAGRAMKDAGHGAIVNLACVSGLRPWEGFVPYSASKATVISLTRGFAKMLAPEVRVNAVAPGPILPPAGADEAQGQRAVEGTLLKRWGRPEDVAAAVLFLLRARYLTGVVLAVDGGRSIA